MRAILYLLIAYLVLVQVAWFAVELSVVSFDDSMVNGVSLIQTLVNTTYPEYIVRTIAAVGAILLTLYADRHPLYKAASFGAFVGTTVITFSWLCTSLPLVFSIFDKGAAGSYNTLLCQSGGNNGFCMLGLASASLSCANALGTLLLWTYTLYQMVRATSTVKLSLNERVVHGLVWIGLAFYLVWTCASILLAQDLTASDYNGLLGIWTYGYLHGCVAFALTAAAVSSMGADQAFRTGTWFLNTMLFFTLFPGSVLIARTQQYGGVPANSTNSCLGDSMSGTCMEQEAMAAGMIGVAAAALLIHLASIPMAFLRTQPEYAAGVNQGGVKTIEADNGMYSNAAYGTAAPSAYDNTAVSSPVVGHAQPVGQYAV